MYTNGMKEFKQTLIGELTDYSDATWMKLVDLEGRYGKDELKIKGFFTKHNDFAAEDAKGLDKVNIFLVLVNDNNENYFVKVPHALGVKIVDDFNTFDGTINEYVDGVSIKMIKTYKTKYGSKSANYVLW